MCGIAGYSLDPGCDVDRTLLAQALLAGIAERGADAVGLAHRSPASPLAVHKQRSGASELLERLRLPDDASQALLHVRDYTKGHPSVAANNHPVRHGAVVGIHNGTIVNDEEVLARHGFARAEPGMTVDSEAIFALAEASASDPGALEELRGSMAAAWIDERDAEGLLVARGVGRPLWLGYGRRCVVFASTKAALAVAERFARVRLRKRELPEGTLIRLEGASEVDRHRFRPDSRFREQALPAVRAPHEGVSCLLALAAIAAQ